MSQLSEAGRRKVEEIAARHGVSVEAALTLLAALLAGHGNQAQFSHPELGGMGQWSRGGMVMVGDMFNNALKARVDALCTDLSGLIGQGGMLATPSRSQSQAQGAGSVSLFVPGGSSSWWPAELGVPASTGAQNDLRYAYFPATRRLAIDRGGRVSVHDTGEHQIFGVGQQQGADRSITFTSQLGTVRVADLPVVGSGSPNEATGQAASEPPAEASAAEAPAPGNPPEPGRPAASVPRVEASAAEAPAPGRPPEPVQQAASAPRAEAGEAGAPSPGNVPAEDDVFGKIERLSELHRKGILTDAEYEAKKAELLARL